MASFTGSLKPKKKQELQDIANALSLPTNGTKDDIETRIREHLDANEATLSDSTTFSGLYTRRKRVGGNLGPVEEKQEPVSDDENTPPPTGRNARKTSRGAVALRSKETHLAPPAPVFDASSIPLPPSPVRSVLNDAIAVIPEAPAIVTQAISKSEFVRGGEVYLKNVRHFVSNSYNIATLTVLSELLFIIYVIVPWNFLHVPLAPPFNTRPPAALSPVILQIPYAPLNFILSAAPYITTLQWAVPTLLVPQLFGALISFSEPRKTVDPLSAGIVRVACAVAGHWGLADEVLGTKWRILSASVAAAFALSEAVERRQATKTKIRRSL